MSLSPKDDPRTWLVPGPRAVARPPFQARLLYYDITKSQFALLRAMREHARIDEGELCDASPKTLGEISGLSRKHIYNLIHGWTRNGRYTPGFLELKVLERKRKAKRGPLPAQRDQTNRTAAYLFHEWALRLKPELLKRLEAGVQQRLPMEAGLPKVFRQPLPKSDQSCGNGCRNPRSFR